MSFPLYPKYRASGIQLLESIPSHWEIAKFRHLFSESQEKIKQEVVGPMLSVSGYRGIEIKEYDDENQRRSNEDLIGYRIARAGQLVVNTMWLNYAGLGVSEHEGHVSPAYRCYGIDPNLERRFVHHLLRSGVYVQGYTQLLTGVRPNSLQMSRDDLMAFPILLPPKDEQIKIAIFLDREAAKIDELIAEQERLIELLNGKRQAVISHVITKGLNSHAVMKPSGIEWIGDVPEHWKVRRVKAVSTFTTSGPRGWSERVGDEGALFVQSGDLNNMLGVEFTECKRVRVGDDSEAARTQLRHGDLVVCITGAKTGNVAVCLAIPEPAYVNQHLCLIRPSEVILPTFLGMLLKSALGQEYFDLSQYGLKQGLSLEDVKGAPVLVPPRPEQERIVNYLELETAAFDNLVAEGQQANLSEKGRQLITAWKSGDRTRLTEVMSGPRISH